MSQNEFKSFYRRNLPHIQTPGATLFVTFQLAGSIPQHVLAQWRTEKLQFEKEKSRLLRLQNDSESASRQHRHSAEKNKHLEWKRQWFRKFEKTLDSAESGPVWLKDNRIAKEIARSLHHRDGKMYCLDSYCIMSNHVHVVFTPLAIQSSKTDIVNSAENIAQTEDLCYTPLSSIMQSLKGYTARKANQLLGRSGVFWQRESYDHVIRDASEWRRIITYVLNNPVKAGLVDTWEKWQWSYCRLDFSPQSKM
ncbi:hypothetical protein F4009_21085 [Candidatus Poribacteria bacterium]|nr:hypothetical protein [Candidatus Poribacteria bacterium]MYH81446.1 hypothetical protein [Candidatus Poribacteria bacterium]MYK96457.1 hypothetical protein [Candidatus Poribacteria bacterium]